MFGQELAFNSAVGFKPMLAKANTAFKTDWGYERKHCKAVTGGAAFFVGGAVEIIGGGIWLNQLPSNPNNGRPSSVGLLPGIIFVDGLLNFVVGGFIFLGGEIYEHSGNRRYSIISRGNQMGVAYNF